MVAKHIIFPYIVVESKAEACHRPVYFPVIIWGGEESLLDGAPVKFLQVQGFVCQDVDFIIEVPRVMKRI